MMQNKRYAITGGIGSGKTAVCNILKKKGFSVFSCDEISRELWHDASYRRALAERFPDCAQNGEIVKEKLSALVFTDQDALEKLNRFSHPRIMDVLIKKTSECALSFSEVPLLFEGGYERFFDGVIALRRTTDLRLNAVARRDGIPKSEVMKRMAFQFDPTLLETKNCLILENNGDWKKLDSDVDRILKRLGL